MEEDRASSFRKRLFHAVFLNDLPTLKGLININTDVQIEDILLESAWSGRMNILKYLVDEKRADVNARDVFEKRPFDFAPFYFHIQQYKPDVDRSVYTPVFYTVTQGHLPCVDFLVTRGANLHAEDGRPPLSSSDLGVLKFLFDHDADVDLHTSLIAAAESGREDTLQFLIDEKGGNINLRDENRETLLHRAIRWTKSSAAAEFLLSRGADINAKDFKGETPLHHSVIYNNINSTRLLLERGAEVNVAVGITKHTPLHHAALLCHEEIARLLLEKGADPNARPNTERPALDLSMEELLKNLNS